MAKVAFIFVAPGTDPLRHRSVMAVPNSEVITVGVPNYAAAAELAKALVEEGVHFIELCGGFGHVGTARVAEAVQGKATVGVIRFDGHPALNNESGDTVFV